MTRPRASAAVARIGSLVRRALAAAAVGVGFVVAAVGVVAQPAMAAWSVAVGMVVAVCFHLRDLDVPTVADPRAVRAYRRIGGRCAAAATGVCAVVVGLAFVLGAAAWPVTGLLVVLGIPWSRRALHRVRGRLAELATDPPRVPATRPRPVVVPVAAADMSTAELCLAWQRSYWALLDTSAGSARDRIVGMRGDLLDELDRRDHAGFGRWIDAGARAGSDPGRYLSTDR